MNVELAKNFVRDRAVDEGDARQIKRTLTGRGYLRSAFESGLSGVIFTSSLGLGRLGVFLENMESYSKIPVEIRLAQVSEKMGKPDEKSRLDGRADYRNHKTW